MLYVKYAPTERWQAGTVAGLENFFFFLTHLLLPLIILYNVPNHQAWWLTAWSWEAVLTDCSPSNMLSYCGFCFCINHKWIHTCFFLCFTLLVWANLTKNAKFIALLPPCFTCDHNKDIKVGSGEVHVQSGYLLFPSRYISKRQTFSALLKDQFSFFWEVNLWPWCNKIAMSLIAHQQILMSWVGVSCHHQSKVSIFGDLGNTVNNELSSTWDLPKAAKAAKAAWSCEMKAA